MKANVQGRLQNTTLPRAKPLLPLFEAVMNAFQAIEEVGTDGPHTIDICIERQGTTDNQGPGDIEAFSVIDNGVGFTDDNYESFNTVDSRYKSGTGGKGLGRFLWLKAFSRVEIDSHYKILGEEKLKRRAFVFQPGGDPQENTTVSTATAPCTTVRLFGFFSPYREEVRKPVTFIAQRVVEHFLPLFMNPKCPKVTISDGENINLNAFFRDHFQSLASNRTFSVGGETFNITGFRLHHSPEVHHKIIFAAHYREVIEERLERYLPNLNKKLEDEQLGSFAYLAFVQGKYLDDRVNNERTNFSFQLEPTPETEEATGDIFPGELSLKALREGALAEIAADLRPFLDEINSAKRKTIERYITQEAPQYRVLDRYIDEFIESIPPNVDDKRLEMALHEQLHRKQKELKQEGQKIMAVSANVADSGEYQNRLRDFVERYNEIGKSSLAQYIVHRRVILDLFQKALSRDRETGQYALEEAVHNLVFPMRTTSDEVPFEQQNLWIIDERLTYHSFLASDKALNTIPMLANDSKTRPDILLFNHPLTFSEGDAPLTSIVVVEFKKPARERYDSEDPVSQVYRQIREIKEGHFKDKNGREIKLLNSEIPAYAYVVCDITRQVEIMAQEKNLWPTPDNMGFFGFNQHLNAYVEIISYEKLLQDAKKRNRVLFERLHIPVGSPTA